jgi:hypothetical protein
MSKRILIIVALLVVYDRVEYLYYAFEDSDSKIGFIIKGDPIRIDSYVYFLSIRIQQIIFALIFYYLVPLKSPRWFLYACVAMLVEYPLTYNEPILTIPLPLDHYIPVSAAAFRLCAVGYFMYEVVNKLLKKEGID